MKMRAYQTGTIELMPHTEYGEFAIVGVFAVDAETRSLAYKLLRPMKTKRLTGFFPELERTVFTHALKSAHHEWEALAEMVNLDGGKTAEFEAMTGVAGSDLFVAITHAKEGIIRNKARGAVMATDIQEWIDQAFLKMVMRKEVVSVIPEELKLNQAVAGYLKELKFQKQWKDEVVGNDVYHARFPFTYAPQKRDEQGEEVDGGSAKILRAIKPLFLGHNDSTKLIEHGDAWTQKVRRLNQFNLSPEALIFPVQLPADPNAEQFEHANLVMNDLRREGVHVIEEMKIERFKPFLMTEEILDTPLFAKSMNR